jgi:hypothetical protein
MTASLETRLTSSTLDRYSPEHPLVLVTEYPPDATGGGGVILRGLLTPSERARIVWLTLSPFDPKMAEGWGGMILLRQGSAVRRADGRRSLWRDATLYHRVIAKEILEIARVRQARALWLMMHGAIVPVAARLTAVGPVRTGRHQPLPAGSHRPHVALPVHLTVHDDPVGQALVSRKYLALAPWLAHTFARALKQADSVDTICEGMADRYRRRLGVDSTVVHRGVERPVEPSPPHDRARGLSVGIIGSIYQYAMIRELGRAVALASRRLGVPGKIVVVGQGVGDRLRADLNGAIEVETTGHLNESAAIERLRACFLLYVNYPFDRRAGLFRQTSFPTKVSTYAQAARPLLVHMPADGSVVALTKMPGRYATYWATLRASDGADLMVQLWNDPASHQSAHEPAERVRSRTYDFATNQAMLFRLLNALVPVEP